jgi:hypothetical protein
VGLYQINESVASLKEGKPPDLFAVGLLLGFGRIEVRQHFIQRLIVEINQLPQGVAFLTPPLLVSCWHLIGQKEQFFFSGVEHVGQFVDELLFGEVSKVELLVLNLRDVSVA